MIYVPITTPSGKNFVVSGFAAFFLWDVPGSGNQNIIIGEFVDMVVPGIGGAAPNGASAYSLRLIE